MDPVLLTIGILLVVVIFLQWIILGRIDRVERDIRHNNHLLTGLRTHQSAIARAKTNKGPVHVDSRARTTRRDSDDLPATGRMSMAVHRVRRNDGRINRDS